MTDLEQLLDLQDRLRRMRAKLPELMQKLASADEKESSQALFDSVARVVAEWQRETNSFVDQYKQLEGLVAKYSKEPAPAAERPKPSTPIPFDYGLDMGLDNEFLNFN